MSSYFSNTSPGHDNPTLWSNANHTDDYSPIKGGALPTFNRFVTSGNYSQVKNTQYTTHPMTPTYNQVCILVLKVNFQIMIY